MAPTPQLLHGFVRRRAFHGLDSALTAFLEAGFSERNALEVVLGIGTYTMSTFANRLTRAPIDPQSASYAL